MVAVTGALSYTGRYITRRLLARGESVRGLTNHPGKYNPFDQRVSLAPLNFDRPQELERSLVGATVLYNTYWVRFPRRRTTHAGAVENTRRLIAAARSAGVRRVVHVGIANATLDSPSSYYRGKAELDRIMASSGMTWAILRPTVLFGGERPAEDVLINNIGWMLRRFPVFPVPGNGTYGIQPVYVDDLAAMAVEAGGRDDNLAQDAAGPETIRFVDLVRSVADAVGSRARIVCTSPRVALLGSRLVGLVVGDVVLTRDELDGLMAGLLVSRAPATGSTRFSEWLGSHAGLVGRVWASELGRHYR